MESKVELSSLTRQLKQLLNDWAFLFVQRHSTLRQLFTLLTIGSQLFLHCVTMVSKRRDDLGNFIHLVRNVTWVNDVPGGQGTERMERRTLFEVGGRDWGQRSIRCRLEIFGEKHACGDENDRSQ